MPLRVPTEFASITPEVLMTESTTWRAAAAVSSTRPPFALSLPVVGDQRLERLAGRDVLHRAGDLVADAERDQLVAVEVEREGVAGGERDGAERAP